MSLMDARAACHALIENSVVEKPMRKAEPTGTQPSFRASVRTYVESRPFAVGISIVIAVNAVTLGLETWPAAVAAVGPMLGVIDRVALLIFSVELLLKLWAQRRQFFCDGWNIFDFAIVAIAWVPSAGPLAVLRALRILRVLRLISIVPQMRNVVAALVNSLPGMASVIAVLLLVFYVSAVMATKLFGSDFPQWFGSIGDSMYSLFQIMTLESWSMGIVRPVMEIYPMAWLFFVPFVVITSFAVLNLFIALIVNSMQSLHEEDRVASERMAKLAHAERDSLQREIAALRRDVQRLVRANSRAFGKQ